MSKEKSFKFESAMEELEKIVSKLEGDNASLENSLKLYEQGVEIAEKLRKHLDEAEQRIEVLKTNKSSS
ncbi:MAG: exodeoxyribonuclease VII small subunit [Candidatus Neomarinimicrobiota bacterium]|nr:exodeoxyribonuclease VII small subunit [Candidatus Neomarinimicrobiota bacterium]|tara:strand:+ start:524 stop:730 length:207 start_codon:yes stop_codon:yes gene_type:complete